MEYSSNGKGNLAVTLGAVGTTLGAFGNSGLFNRNNGYDNCHRGYDRDHFVTRDEMFMMNQLAEKDSTIAMLKAESTCEDKMVEVYKQSHAEVVALRESMNYEIKELQREIDRNRREQDAWNAEQLVSNAHMSSGVATNRNSISALERVIGQITQVRVPNNAVCPGWGAVEVTPA